MSLSEDLAWRGLIKDKTFDDIKWLDEPRTFYWGIDASSSDSMQVGNLAAALLARRLIDAGWQAVLLAGGATSLIGDPKDTEERELKPREEVEKNVAAIKQQISRLFAGKEFTPADNYDWFKDVKYLDFLRDVGKNFAMSELMQREFVNERMDSGISYAEFSYSLIQGYDYWQLFKNHGVVLQIGGSDQWGNMLSGVSLIRKKENQEVQAFSMPLVVNKATGRKFGKSEEGTIWLDPDKTTPTQFYQFWMNVDDADVEDYLKIFTLLGREEIEQVMAEQHNNPAGRAAQKKLAEEVTKLVHGGANDSAESVTKYLTGQSPIGEASEEDLAEIRKEIPAIKTGEEIGNSVVEALVRAELASSNTDARRLLQGNAIYINDQPINRENFEESDFQNGRLLLRRGKAFKDSALVELE
jgi:tyrosyl-tRNA synthetase